MEKTILKMENINYPIRKSIYKIKGQINKINLSISISARKMDGNKRGKEPFY